MRAKACGPNYSAPSSPLYEALFELAGLGCEPFEVKLCGGAMTNSASTSEPLHFELQGGDIVSHNGKRAADTVDLKQEFPMSLRRS